MLRSHLIPKDAPTAVAAPEGCEPIDPKKSVIRLPADQYLHLGAPTEWWWHMGTLTAGDRVFGFEINAASFTLLGFTQVMLTDVRSQTHYQASVLYMGPQFDPSKWAESDVSKDWFAKLGDSSDPSGRHVSMHAPQADPTKNMAIKAVMIDEAMNVKVAFDLSLSQQGAPFIVWGTGVMEGPGTEPDPLKRNNYYYSLTHLQASGSITIGTERVEVAGVTWMDHEYGFFGSAAHPVKWILQDMQLNNGVSISNYTTDTEPKLGVRTKSVATVQIDGQMYFVESFVTPFGRTWTSPASHKTYFMQLRVEIPCFEAKLDVTSLVDGQEFPGNEFPTPSPVYEGVASASGYFLGKEVSGTAWNEQAPK